MAKHDMNNLNIQTVTASDLLDDMRGCCVVIFTVGICSSKMSPTLMNNQQKLWYHRQTTKHAVSVKILSTAAQLYKQVEQQIHNNLKL